MAQFETSITVDCSREKLFDLLATPRIHERLSPPDVGLRFINPPERLVLGTRFQFKIQAWKMIQTVTHEITEYEAPHRFVEQQVQGALKKWIHEHLFEETADGKTTMIDRIEFLPPGGLIGALATEDRILDQLEDGFFHRHQQLRKILASEAT